MNHIISDEAKKKLDDYDRLKLEYTRLHEDYRRLDSGGKNNEQLVADIRGALTPWWNLLELLKINETDRPEGFREIYKNNLLACQTSKEKILEKLKSIKK